MLTLMSMIAAVEMAPEAWYTTQMTPDQCRAARALLRMHQPELAKLAGCGLSTIVDFERSRRKVSASLEKAIRRALEDRGVLFSSNDGVKLEPSKPKGRRP